MSDFPIEKQWVGVLHEQCPGGLVQPHIVTHGGILRAGNIGRIGYDDIVTVPRQQSGERIVRRRRIGLVRNAPLRRSRPHFPPQKPAHRARCPPHRPSGRQANGKARQQWPRCPSRYPADAAPAIPAQSAAIHCTSSSVSGRGISTPSRHGTADRKIPSVRSHTATGHALRSAGDSQHSFVSHGLCAGVGHGLRPREAAETFGHLERNGTRLSCRIGIGHGTPYSFQHFPAFHFPSKLRKRHLKSNRPSLAGTTFRIRTVSHPTDAACPSAFYHYFCRNTNGHAQATHTGRAANHPPDRKGGGGNSPNGNTTARGRTASCGASPASWFSPPSFSSSPASPTS